MNPIEAEFLKIFLFGAGVATAVILLIEWVAL
jgi:hypothetical protein